MIGAVKPVITTYAITCDPDIIDVVFAFMFCNPVRPGPARARLIERNAHLSGKQDQQSRHAPAPGAVVCALKRTGLLRAGCGFTAKFTRYWNVFNSANETCFGSPR
jgi:hypothetical protein